MYRVIAAAVLTASLIATPPLMTTVAAQTTAAPDKAKTKKPPSPGQIAARERQKKCAAEWKADKAAGKIEKGQTWPKYWSACNKRLKAAAS